jgi:hypothetical protein
MANAGGYEVEQQRGTEPARADKQNTGCLDPLLARAADFVQQKLALVPRYFVTRDHGCRFLSCGSSLNLG